MDDHDVDSVRLRPLAEIASTYLPSKQEVELLEQLPAPVRTRIRLAVAKAEGEFHEQAMGNHLFEHYNDYDPGTVERKKYEVMRMFDRLAHRVLQAHFQELKALPIHPSTVRRLLYFVLLDVSIRVFREKWQDYIPSVPDADEEDFVLAAFEHQKPVIEQFYAEALRIQQAQLAEAAELKARKVTRGRPTQFTDQQIEQARELKAAGRPHNEIARVLYQTSEPSKDQRRAVGTILKHHERKQAKSREDGSKKSKN